MKNRTYLFVFYEDKYTKRDRIAVIPNVEQLHVWWFINSNRAKLQWGYFGELTE